ncbi:propionate kinase [Coccidioides immitis RMSCC 3703]|uniref:Propionate kinase n=1 Tax=Coccidioides immitis RMSCC 3703 TaxID=454286 RepID=A0A0J8R4P5_COCIT|nr:propionate kinase [Coccidioides immitis RMSCC 3703]
MGLTPLSGLPGATRREDIDPTLVFHYTSEACKLSSSSTKDMHFTQAEEILNKQAGEVDAVVFAGGIGERSAMLRAAIVQKCRCLGLSICQRKNSKGFYDNALTVIDISEKSSQSPAILVCQTNEEYEMAHQCVNNPP